MALRFCGGPGGRKTRYYLSLTASFQEIFMTPKRILVTGATGKVGQAFIKRLVSDRRYDDFTVRALIHNRTLEAHERLETVRGSIQHLEVVQEALDGVTHVLHLATVKE